MMMTMMMMQITFITAPFAVNSIFYRNSFLSTFTTASCHVYRVNRVTG